MFEASAVLHWRMAIRPVEVQWKHWISMFFHCVNLILESKIWIVFARNRSTNWNSQMFGFQIFGLKLKPFKSLLWCSKTLDKN